MRGFRAWAPAVLGGLLMSAMAGCAAPGPIRHEEGKQAHVVFLPGIGGDNPVVQQFGAVMREELEGVSVQTWDWTDVEFSTILGDLIGRRRNLRRSEVLASELIAWRRRNPDMPLYLVATSGGAGIVLFTCRRLPEDFVFERIVLISPALSPDVDLGPLLSRSRREVFHYYSRNDRFILGLGTILFGTADRRHVRSAGLTGFKRPAATGKSARLEELSWEPSMLKLGNAGTHLGAFSRGFLRAYIVPIFQPPERGETAEAKPASGT